MLNKLEILESWKCRYDAHALFELVVESNPNMDGSLKGIVIALFKQRWTLIQQEDQAESNTCINFKIA